MLCQFSLSSYLSLFLSSSHSVSKNSAHAGRICLVVYRTTKTTGCSRLEFWRSRWLRAHFSKKYSRSARSLIRFSHWSVRLRCHVCFLPMFDNNRNHRKTRNISRERRAVCHANQSASGASLLPTSKKVWMLSSGRRDRDQRTRKYTHAHTPTHTQPCCIAFEIHRKAFSCGRKTSLRKSTISGDILRFDKVHIV